MVTLDRDFIEKNCNLKSNLTVINVSNRRIDNIDLNGFKGLKKLNNLESDNQIENLNESHIQRSLQSHSSKHIF